jgi:hypothetical protein
VEEPSWADVVTAKQVQVTWTLPGIQHSSAKAPRQRVLVSGAGRSGRTLQNINRG